MLWLPGPPAACSQDYRVRHYTVDDGLPSSRIQDTTQDALGQMWFATRSGVAAYDGSRWAVYNVAHGLTWADIFALEWDAAGVLWSVGSVYPFKVSSFEQDHWKTFPNPDGLPPDASISAFAVFAEGPARRVAVGTDRGLLVGDGTVWRRITAADGLPAEAVTALAALDGRLLVATTGGVVELRGEEVDTTLNASLPESCRDVLGMAVEAPAVPATAVSSGGPRLWLYGSDWIGHLTGGRFFLLAEDLPFALPFPSARLAAAADRRGGLYLGHSAALFHYHPEAGLRSMGRNHGLLADGVTSLFLDREDNLWIGSRRGLSKIANRRFTTYNRRHGLLDDEVTAVLERRDGEIVLGHPGGLSFLGGPEGRTLDLAPLRQGPRLERVRDLAEDRAGNLWIGAGGPGLARLDPAGRLTWFAAGEGLSGEVAAVLISEDGDGHEQVWVGTDQGLFVRRGRRFEEASSGDPKVRVRKIFQGSGGEIHLATSSGLHCFYGTWRNWSCSAQSCNSTFAFLETTDRGLWVGTADGLYRTEGDRLVKETEPAVDHPVYFMARDELQRIWFGIDNGVLRWDGRALDHFTVRDGLAGRETNRSAGVVDARGRLWIGSERGVTVFSEAHPGPPRAPPSVRLTDLEAAGQIRPLATAQQLPHDANDVVFRFRAISLVDEERLKLSWWLEGYEPEWATPQVSPTHEVRYTNLPPADYRFHVRAMNAEGTWSTIATSAVLSVAKPYWQRWWFFLMVAALVAAALFLAQSHVAQKRYSRRLEAEVEERVDQLREIEGELVQSQKLEAIGLLAGGIAHDFNNFLTVLLGNLSLLALPGRTESQRSGDLEDAKAAVIRASKLTQQLLTFSRGGAPVRQAASITEVIEESSSFVLSGSKVRCQIDLADDLWVVDIDADQISQLLNNLLINAMQAMPAGGTVSIVGENVEKAPPGLPEGRYVVIRVADQGTGIPQELLAQIFDPYFTTKEDGKGIGLASAYSIAKRHDGLLTVESQPGKGATFSLHLPASEARIVEHEASGVFLLPGTGRVLIVDDEEAVRRVTGSLVTDLGYQAGYAADGAEALEAYAEAMKRSRPYNAVIMDLTIPGGMGGQEAIQRLLEIDPEVKAIVVSGYSNDEVLANYRDYGFQGMLGKPFRSSELARALSELLGVDGVAPEPRSEKDDAVPSYFF